MKLNVHANIFNKVYRPYLEDFNERIIIFYGGSGSGKSHFCAQRLVYKALKEKLDALQGAGQ